MAAAPVPGGTAPAAGVAEPGGRPVPEAPSTLRGRRTQAALVAAGRSLFEEMGYAEATADLVCRRAGVSHGTFYTYFDSKEALLREVAHGAVGDMFAAARVGHDVPDDPYLRIEAANRLYLRAWARNARILRVIDSAAAAEQDLRRLLLDLREVFVRRGAEGLRRLQAAGRVHPDLDPRLTAIALGAMVEQFAHVWLDLGEAVDEETAVRTLTDLWARAIALKP